MSICCICMTGGYSEICWPRVSQHAAKSQQASWTAHTATAGQCRSGNVCIFIFYYWYYATVL